jgi:hypothetical protein
VSATRLSNAPNAREQLLRHEPRGEGEDADVDQRVADSDHAHQREHSRLIGQQAAEGERQTPKHDADALEGRQSAPAHQHRGAQRARDRARAHRGGQHAHAGVADVEQIERDHHEEHVEEAARQRLPEADPEQQAGVAIANKGAKALDRLTHDPPQRLGRATRRSLVGERNQQSAGPEREDGGRGEHGRGAPDVQEDGGQQRAEQRAG